MSHFAADSSYRVRVAGILLALAILTSTCFAQGEAGAGQGGTGGATGGAGTGGTGGTGGVGGAGGIGGPGGPGGPGGIGNQSPMPGGNTRQQQQQQSPFPDMSSQQRPIFLSGKVILNDGTPPPDSVVIERVCNGSPRPEAYTDSKGRFSFQLGQNRGMMADASVASAADSGFGGASTSGLGGSRGGFGNPNGGVSERDLMGCELRAVLAGFRSESVNLSGRRAFDNPDVGTIVLRRLANVEGTTISATSLNAPKEAHKSFDKARDLIRKKKPAEAQKELEKAVAAYPKYATAWFELGQLQQQKDQIEEARNSYSQALAADAKFVSPYLQLALLSAKEKKWQDVADTTDRLLKLNPVDFPQAFFYNSVANYNLRKLDAAEKSARDAVKIDGNHRMPKAAHLLGIILAEKQDYAGAAENLKSYLKFSPNAQDAEMVKKQLAELERFAVAPKPAGQQP